jgi:hypothetical protein
MILPLELAPMTNTLRSLAAFSVLLLAAAVAKAAEPAVNAAPAVYVNSANAEVTRLAAWPGYYYYGVYYGSYRWRYQPYYTFYANPWFDSGYYYTPYSYGGPAYGWPGYASGYGYYGPYTFTWPHYGAYGYTYYGPVTYGY